MSYISWSKFSSAKPPTCSAIIGKSEYSTESVIQESARSGVVRNETVQAGVWRSVGKKLTSRSVSIVVRARPPFWDRVACQQPVTKHMSHVYVKPQRKGIVMRYARFSALLERLDRFTGDPQTFNNDDPDRADVRGFCEPPTIWVNCNKQLWGCSAQRA